MAQTKKKKPVTSKITNHRSHKKYNNNEKVWKLVRITKMWHRDTKWRNAVWKMVPIDLLSAGLPQTFNLLKKKYSICEAQ